MNSGSYGNQLGDVSFKSLQLLSNLIPQLNVGHEEKDIDYILGTGWYHYYFLETGV